MIETRRIRCLIFFERTALLATLFAGVLPFLASAQTKTHTTKTFAQKLVEATQAKHSEADEISISATTSHGCVEIASTDKSDIGGKCEKEDSEPMRTGKPVVEKEKDGFDVSLPLHDSMGNMIGAVGVGFKPAPGQTESSVVEQAQIIAAEMGMQIPSKAKLFEPSE
jgi:hypothetical protein